MDRKIFGMNRKNTKKFYMIEWKKTFLFVLLLSTLAAGLYWDYLTGAKVYVFRDIAGDSYNQFTPYYLNLAYEIEGYGRILPWNWTSFLGMSQSTNFDLFNSWIYLFGSEKVGYLFGFLQVIKVILSGLLFYLYSRILGFDYCVRIVMALSYAFCGHMIARGAWMRYPVEVVCFAFLLLSIELWLNREKSGIIALPIATALTAFALGSYGIIIYIFISLGYIVFRINIKFDKVNLKDKSKFIGFSMCLVFIGTCIASVTVLPSIIETFNSPRVATAVSGNSGATEDKISLFTNLKTLVTCYLRTFCNDLSGTALDYKGQLNYLEGPAFYCGILNLVMLPCAFQKGKGNSNMWHFLLLLFIAIYCIIEPVRVLANAMDSNTFKLSSFWIIVVLIYLGGQGLDNFLHGQYNKKIICIWALMICAPILALYLYGYSALHHKSMITVFAIIGVYVLVIIYKGISIKFKKNVLIAIVAVEVLILSYPAVNERYSLTKEQYQEYSSAAIKNIVNDLQNEKDSEDLFRIDCFIKDFGAAWKNNYMGTRGYIGGSAFSKEMQEFISSIGNTYMQELGFSRKVYGFTGINEINTLLGVRYLLYNVDENYKYIPFGYEKIEDDYNGMTIYENKYFLPLFYTYDETISKEDFYQLSVQERRQGMLEKIVVENENCLSFNEVEETDRIEESETVAQVDEDIIIGFGNAYEIVVNENSNFDYYLLKTDMSTTAQEMISMDIYFSWGDSAEERIDYYTATGSETMVITIPYQDNIESIWVSSDLNDNVTLSNTEVIGVKESYFDSYKNSVAERKESDITIEKFEGDTIETSVNIKEEKEYVFAAIPYDANWKVFVDGKEQPLICANLGFMAVLVDSGNHTIIWKYEEKNNMVFVFLSMAAAFTLIGVNYKFYRNSKKEKN